MVFSQKQDQQEPEVKRLQANLALAKLMRCVGSIVRLVALVMVDLLEVLADAMLDSSKGVVAANVYFSTAALWGAHT